LAPPGYGGPWPRLSVWHGEADNVVAPSNGAQLALQWVALHGLDHPIRPRHVHAGLTGTCWGKPDAPAVELWQLKGTGHLYPTVAGQGISAAAEIARFWGV
jgi:poly(3-hydroxybutyrate) depolymerase